MEKPAKPLQTVILNLELRQLSISVVGKVQELYKEKIVSRRKELALFTFKGLKLIRENNYE